MFSYNVDDLKAVVERNTAKRRREMLEAENILREELSKYRLWQQSLGAIPTIAKLQVTTHPNNTTHNTQHTTHNTHTINAS